MHTNIIHAWLHCQSNFNCTKSVIHNVSKLEKLPIKYISSDRPPGQPVTSVFSFPQYFPQFSLYPSKGK